MDINTEEDYDKAIERVDQLLEEYIEGELNESHPHFIEMDKLIDSIVKYEERFMK